MLDLSFTAPQLDHLALDLAATQQQAERALKSTLRKMAVWIRARSVKTLSDDLKIQQKIIRRRLKLSKVRQTMNGPQITVWYGLDPISLIYLKPKKTGGGVAAYGGRFVKDGFIAAGRNGKRQVFKRRGAERLPIDKQSADINKDAEAALQRRMVEAAAFEAQFFKIFEHELQWQTR